MRKNRSNRRANDVTWGARETRKTFLTEQIFFLILFLF